MTLGLSSAKIGKAIGRARRTVDLYIADLKAATEMELDLKIFRMNFLGYLRSQVIGRPPKDSIEPFTENGSAAIFGK